MTQRIPHRCKLSLIIRRVPRQQIVGIWFVSLAPPAREKQRPSAIDPMKGQDCIIDLAIGRRRDRVGVIRSVSDHFVDELASGISAGAEQTEVFVEQLSAMLPFGFQGPISPRYLDRFSGVTTSECFLTSSRSL